MFMCQYCIQEFESRGERFTLNDNKYCECEFCGDVDVCIDVRFKDVVFNKEGEIQA